jgi:hypothetical protein
MHVLIEAGLFEKYVPQGENTRTYVKLDPSTCVRQLYDAWLDRQGMPVTHEEFDVHRSVRRICKIPHSEPLPTILLEGAFRRLIEHGNFSRPEIRIFLPIHPENKESTLDWMDQRLDAYRRRRPRDKRSGLNLDDLRAALPPVMRAAPFTCLTADLPYEFEAPSPLLIARLWKLDRLFATASLYALTTAPSVRRSEILRERLVTVERVQEIFDRFSPGRELTAAQGLRSRVGSAIRQGADHLPMGRHNAGSADLPEPSRPAARSCHGAARPGAVRDYQVSRCGDQKPFR